MLPPNDSPFPAVYERYKRYRLAVAASLADGDGSESTASCALLFATGLGGAVDPPGLVEAMRAELDPGQRLIPLVALRLFLERSGLPITKAHPACAAQVKIRNLFDCAIFATAIALPTLQWENILAASAKIRARCSLLPVHIMQQLERGIHLSALFGISSSASSRHGGVILKALLGKLAMPCFPSFVSDLHAMVANTLRTETGGEISKAVAIDEITGAEPGLFGISVCTVDGQIANIGDASVDLHFPLMAAVRPLLYGLACKVSTQ